jgi:hypothetical protein
MASMADIRDKELAEKETALIAEIESLLPEFAHTFRESADVVIIHQDSFGSGLPGRGKNRETLITAKASFLQ